MSAVAGAGRRQARAAPSLLDRRLVFVTGKGGVGKSTVAAAIGKLAARRGKRTIIAELARRDDVWRALRADDPRAVFKEHELEPGLFTISIDPELAMEEYLTDQLPVRALADVLTNSRAFGYLAAATPGLRELLAVGKVWELAQLERRQPGRPTYDLVVVDAAASGHALAILRSPRTFAAVAVRGPIARHARMIHATLADARTTAVLAVAAPTEASVTETLELADGVRGALGYAPAAVVLNGMLRRHFRAGEAAELERALDELGGAAAGPAAGALTVALASHRRAGAQAAQAARLRRGLDAAPITLPFLHANALGPAEIDALARRLERRL